MSANNKTSNIGLNQWQGNEYPLRIDFNDDNAIIDSQINVLDSRIESLESTTDQELLESIKNVDGSGCELDADMIDGRHSNEFVYRNTKEITVTGDANTYYPVVLDGMSSFEEQSITKIHVFRDYSWLAPDSWYTAIHKGHLNLTFDVIARGWGGGNYFFDNVVVSQVYATQIADMTLAEPDTSKVIVWLRGGGARYNISSDSKTLGVSVYYDEYINYEGTEYETIFSPKTDPITELKFLGVKKYTTIDDQYIGKGYRDPFTEKGKVWTSLNDGSESGLDADTVDGYHQSELYTKKSQERNVHYRNNPSMSASSYNQGHLELTTTDGSNPIIGFHRGGYTAVALYHKGDADNERLKIMRHDGTDYYLWDSGFLRVHNGGLQYKDGGVWKSVGTVTTVDKLVVGQACTTSPSYTTAHVYNGSGILTQVSQKVFETYYYMKGYLKIVVDGVVVYDGCGASGYGYGDQAYATSIDVLTTPVKFNSNICIYHYENNSQGTQHDNIQTFWNYIKD